MNIQLITMPFDVVDEPNPALGLLKPAIEQHGHRCSMSFFSMRYAAQIDQGLYYLISKIPFFFYLLVGEWIFSKPLGKPFSDRYFDLLVQQWPEEDVSSEFLTQICHLWNHAPDFIQNCFESVDWGQFDLVGFSTRHQTLNPSLALAAVIKRHYPRLPIVFGGVNVFSRQGQRIIKMYDVIDFVCLGEGETVFPLLLETLQKQGDVSTVPGFAWRNPAGEIVVNGPPATVDDLDRLPTPDYDDFFSSRMRYGLREENILLPYQLSRGCLWREQTGGCTYCAIDCLGGGYRQKSARKVVRDLSGLMEKYHTRAFRFDDDYASPVLFDVLDALSEKDQGLDFYIMFKAHVKKPALKAVKAQGGQAVFVGVESLHPHVLKLMNKGVSALTNLRVMKYCQEIDLRITYFILVGMPYETDEDIQEMVSLMRWLYHLPPPHSVILLRLMNYSPLDTQREAYDILNKRPPVFAEDIYAYEHRDDLMAILPFYEFDYGDGQDVQRKMTVVEEAVNQWLYYHNRCVLVYVDQNEILRIVDTRPDAVQNDYVLSGLARRIYLACSDLCSRRSLLKTFATGTINQDDVEAILDGFVQKGLIVTDGSRYLSLALDLSERMPTEGLAMVNMERLVKLSEFVYIK